VNTPDTAFDIVVVGAGISGAYTAYRLQQQQLGVERPKRIALFNLDDRIGGRLLTRTLPGMPHVHAELGGMRFIPGNQYLTTGLIGELELPVRDFPMGNPDPAIGGNANYLYLRRRHLLFSDLADPAKVPYHLTSFERGKTPDALTNYVMNFLVPNAGTLTLDQWFGVEVLGKPLYQYGLWELLYLVLSSEGFEFVQDAGGYDSNVANANAVATLPPHHGADVSYQTLVGGYDLLPKTIVRQFERWGGTVRLNHRLTSFGSAPRSGALSGRGRRSTASSPRGRYRLTFRRTATNEFRTRDLTGRGSEQIVHADRIVLAMPRRALELVECEWFSGLSDVRAHIASVLIQPAFKLFLGYEYPWWRQLGLVAGRSITDMPVRQTYYFGTEGEQPGADRRNLNSLMMVSYNDLQSVPFWKGFERDAPFEGHRARFVERRESPVPPSAFDATQGMVKMAQLLVREIHGQKTLPSPYSALYHDWTEDPYGGGWHKWKPGVRFDRVMKTMRRPVPTEAIHICGEAYSNYQGWVEGALQTAELMLEEHFSVPRPNWIPPDYDLGP
jgi:lysine 2-monooxygenase